MHRLTVDSCPVKGCVNLTYTCMHGFPPRVSSEIVLRLQGAEDLTMSRLCKSALLCSIGGTLIIAQARLLQYQLYLKGMTD